MPTSNPMRSYAPDIREKDFERPDFMQLLIISHDAVKTNLYQAYQKVYENGVYSGIRLTGYLRYNELLNEDRFHFDPLELQSALQVAKQRGDLTLSCFAVPLVDFAKL